MADDDAFFFLYVNSTTGNATLAAAFQNADDESAGADVVADNDLAGIDLVEFAGVTAVTGFVAANFDII